MRYLSVNSSGIWRFRFQIPPTHQHLFDGRSELKRSFGKVPSEVAQIKALELEAHARRVMSGLQSAPEIASDELIECKLRSLVKAGKQKVADGVSILSRSPKLKRKLIDLQGELTEYPSPGEQALDWGAFPALAWLNDIYPGIDSPTLKRDKWLGEAGVTPKSKYAYHLTNFFELMRTAQKAFLLADLKTVKMILNRLEALSDFSYQLGTAVVADALVKQVQRPKKKSRSKYNLQKALKAYQEDKRIIRGINSQSNSSTKIESELRREEGRCRVVHQLVGIDDITKVSRKDVIKAIELLSQFPVVPLQSKFRTRFDKLPLEKWIDLGRELGLKTLSHRTIFAYVSAASAFYEWANRHLDSQIGNPWRGVIKKRKSGQNQLHERNPFSIEQLSALFSQEPFTKGEKGLRRRNRKRLCYQYWLPLIALHTGLRANEIAQLYRGDIKSRDGIVYFDLTSSRPDQSLKNSGAVRIVPVHSKLLELGFMEYLGRFSPEQRIFPELSFKGRDGYFKSAGEWFRRFLKGTLPESEKVSFYSFRHTFADSFKQQQVSPTIPGTLLGHKSNTMSFDVYGGSLMLETLQRNIEMVDFSAALLKVKPFEA